MFWNCGEVEKEEEFLVTKLAISMKEKIPKKFVWLVDQSELNRCGQK